MEMKKLILTMSFPIMISMLVQALYNIVDSMFIARVSEDALAAVSLCYPVQMVMVAVACGTGVGINALLSRYLGEKKQEKASRVAMHGLFCALCNWIVFALIGIFFSKSFLQLFSDDAQDYRNGNRIHADLYDLLLWRIYSDHVRKDHAVNRKYRI